MKKGWLIAWLMLAAGFTQGQDSTYLPLYLSINSSQPALPVNDFVNFFSSPLHLGGTVGTALKWNQDSTHQLLQTAKLGYFYHRNNQKAVQLYTEFSYRYQMHERLSAAVRLGIGYLHSFPDLQSYKLSDQGEYEAADKGGRAQLIGTTALGLQYIIADRQEQPVRLFTEYQFWLQYPFVNQYVPVLPYTTLHMGVQYPLIFSKKSK